MAESLKRIIPSTGEALPVVGLGTWLKLDVAPTGPEREKMIELFRTFVKGGGKLVDTSPMYGRAETAIGELAAAAGVANDLFYATKVWTTGGTEGEIQMKESLRKLKREKLDLIQIHNLLDWQKHLKTLQRWKAEGKVRYTGVTHYTVSAHAQLETIVRKEPVDFVQLNYSIGIRDAERSLLPTAKDKGVAVLINEPLEKGHLFKAVREKSPPAWAKEAGMNTWAHFFLGYVLSHPAVTCVIPATGNLTNLTDNLSTAAIPLPDAKMREKMAKYWEVI